MEGDCHFTSGNLRARKRVEQARHILDAIGIGGQRVEMFNLSSSEAPLFIKHVREMNDRILQLGPNPVKAGAAQTRSEADARCAAAL
jgi:coenzyme F420-reducing hydrogenase delta subunit